MQEYKAINDREMKKSTRIVAVCFGFGLIAVGIFILSIYTALVGAVILLAVILNKSMIVREDGVHVIYDMAFFKYQEFWSFEDIIEIQKEQPPDRTQMALHFTKESLMAKRLIFGFREADSVIELATSKNPKIEVHDVEK
ncbi:MAG TPA: hypothetical protein VJY37_03715 [Anaerovoracaceae bacterium]|nr:hypothetical protein [Anaerovoracaceae bacterium]